jgi:hypothetical protein
MDAVETRLLQLRDTSSDETKITAANRRMAEISALRVARTAEHERKRAEMLEAMVEVASLCAGHRETVTRQLDALREQYADQLETFLRGDKERSARGKMAVSLCDHLDTIMSISRSRPAPLQQQQESFRREEDDSVRFGDDAENETEIFYGDDEEAMQRGLCAADLSCLAPERPVLRAERRLAFEQFSSSGRSLV